MLSTTRINRIRLEFKVFLHILLQHCGQYVLIESDWNLKEHGRNLCQSEADVLIESDWNLKQVQPGRRQPVIFRINRIRLEFKGMRRTAGRNVNGVLIESDWNLKLFSLYEIGWPVISVLIESDWNLKIFFIDRNFCFMSY